MILGEAKTGGYRIITTDELSNATVRMPGASFL